MVYPWYLLWGMVALAPVAGPRERNWLLMLSAVASTMAVPGLTNTAIATVAAVVGPACAVWSAWCLTRRRQGLSTAPYGRARTVFELG